MRSPQLYPWLYGRKLHGDLDGFGVEKVLILFEMRRLERERRVACLFGTVVTIAFRIEAWRSALSQPGQFRFRIDRSCALRRAEVNQPDPVGSLSTITAF